LSFGVNINSFEAPESVLNSFENDTFNSLEDKTSTFFIVNFESDAAPVEELETGVLTIQEKVAVNSGDVTSFNSESKAETAI
jgi:hypothetical protein